jgi:hypothetical protein
MIGLSRPRTAVSGGKRRSQFVVFAAGLHQVEAAELVSINTICLMQMRDSPAVQDWRGHHTWAVKLKPD